MILELTSEEVEVFIKRGGKNIPEKGNSSELEGSPETMGSAGNTVPLEGAEWKQSGKSQQGPALWVVLVGRGTEELCPYADSNAKCLLILSGCHEIGFDALQSSLWQLHGELTRGA